MSNVTVKNPLWDREGYPTYHELLELAIEAMKRSNCYLDKGHPEDLVAGLAPTLEAVAIGFGAGMTWARKRVSE